MGSQIGLPWSGVVEGNWSIAEWVSGLGDRCIVEWFIGVRF